MAALPGGEPPHPLPGRLGPAFVFPDERGLARLQLIVKRSSLNVNGETRVIGIFGHPIAHTRSPAMHNAAFRALGLAYIYIPFCVPAAALGKATSSIRTLNLVGINVTVPHKEEILRYLDELSPAARLYRAVNTVINRHDRLYGENTDGPGFLRSLAERKRSVRDREVVLIGAGGAARAVLVALIQAGSAQITIVNRTPAHAQRLIRAYQSLGTTQLVSAPLDALQDPLCLKRAAVVVNSIPLGLHTDTFPALDYGATPRRCLFYDLVYGPRPTVFLQRAHHAQRPTRDGRRMLLHQGALAFELWTGQPAPLRVMSSALTRSLTVPA